MGLKSSIDITARQRKTIRDLLRTYVPDAVVWVYGSRVKWTSRPDSDLDMVVFSMPDQSLKVSDLKEAFEESDLPFRIDLFVWDEVPEQFHKNIQSEHVVLQEKEERTLPSGWDIFPLEDCMDAIIDYRGKTPKKTTSGIPLVTAKIVKGGRILPVHEYIAEEDYDDWMRRGLPHEGDILLTTEAPLGEVAQLDGRKVALAQRLITLRGRDGFLDNTFLKFLIQSAIVQDQLTARASGTTVLGIKQSELRKVELPIPEIGEQKSIAHILGALDDKIELNRKMNETLEGMAQALFKSWFVDFDPVIDNALAAGNPIPDELTAKAEKRTLLRQGSGGQEAGASCVPPDLAKLFPDSFEESELGWIPTGWVAGKLKDIAQNPRRSIKVGEASPGTPYIALQHMPKRSIALSEWDTADEVASGKYQFNKGEILFGKLRPYFHKVGVAPVNGVCSTDILVVTPKQKKLYALVLGHMSSVEFVDYATASSSGTRMPRTNWTDMGNYEIAIPDIATAEILTEHVQKALGRIQSNIEQSRILSSLRDTLLPKLLSGELRIEDVEKFVGGV